jgi:PAS domain S-box-containing protein
MFPLLTWAALRGGPRWASVSILAIATVAAWCTARGRGPFAVNDGALPGSPVFELQLYLALLAISALLLSAFSEQRRRALETLTLQTAIREGFLNGSAAMLVLKDLADRNVIVNTAYAAMVGRSRSDLVGRSNVEFLSPDDAALMRARDRRVIERGEPITFDESLDLNGKRRLFVVTRFPVRDVYGTISYIGVIAREVTVERELTSRLQRAQRVEMVGHLAAGLAHDLNNMLTAIELNAGGIRESAELSPDDSSALDAITTATASATKLTRRLMALGRAQAPAPVPIAIDDAIRELTPMFQVLVRGLIDLDIELRAPGARVLADPLAVEQIALNLVSNARDAIATEGSITVATTVVPAAEVAVEESVRTLTAHWVRLRVSDTGHGMDDATLRSLFEPFFTTKGSAGTGLGLYTTSLLVREAGGVIRATSSAGAGTVFTVDLPLLAGSPPP